MSEPKRPTGFVSLKSLKQGPPDPTAALAELRQIYFKTTKRTIEHDFDQAIDLLKSLPDEDTREKATVYMEGIAQLRNEWGTEPRKTGQPGKPAIKKPRRPAKGRSK